MRILFDHGTPAPLQSFFTDHSIYKAKDLGWDTLSNGELLKAAEEAGFHVLLTADKNIRFQQNLSKLSIAIVVLGNPTWPMLSEYVKRVIEAVISRNQAPIAKWIFRNDEGWLEWAKAASKLSATA